MTPYSTVAVAVAKRTHKISRASLTVKLITKKKPRPRPVKKQCLFLKGIPDGCSSELVMLFVENRVDMDEEPKIQYGEMPGTAICNFSRDIPGNLLYLKCIFNVLYLFVPLA